MRDRFINIAKVLISLGLIAYLFLRVNVGEVITTLRTAHTGLLLLALLLYLGAITLGGFKWYILLRAQKILVPFRSVLAYTFVGVFFSNFLPANVGGDVMRGYGLARHTARTAEAAVSVVVDRLVGLIAFMSAAAVAAVVAVLTTGRSDLGAFAVAASVGTLVLVLGFAVILSRRLRALAERLFHWRMLTPLAPLYGRLSEAVGAYRFHYRALFAAYLTSISVLFLSTFVNFALSESLGGGIPLLYIFLFNPLIGFALLLPISIGGLGVNQSAYVLFYGIVGVPENLAFTVSLLMQLIIYVTSLPGGVLWWRSRGVAETTPAPSQVPHHKPETG